MYANMMTAVYLDFLRLGMAFFGEDRLATLVIFSVFLCSY